MCHVFEDLMSMVPKASQLMEVIAKCVSACMGLSVDFVQGNFGMTLSFPNTKNTTTSKHYMLFPNDNWDLCFPYP